jgi:hypothetical protein
MLWLYVDAEADDLRGCFLPRLPRKDITAAGGGVERKKKLLTMMALWTDFPPDS